MGFIFIGAGLVWASGLPPAYEEKRPEVVTPPPEKPPALTAAELHDVRIIFAVSGAPADEMDAAFKLLYEVLEKRAAVLARRFTVTPARATAQITVELKGCADPRHALEILMAPGRLEFQALAERDVFLNYVRAAGWPEDKLLSYEHPNYLMVRSGDRGEFQTRLKGFLPDAGRILWSAPVSTAAGEGVRAALAVGDGMTVTAGIEAAAVKGAAGAAQVDFTLSGADGIKFSGLTGRHVGEALAVVFDGELLYSARVKEQTYDRVTIYGELDLKRAEEIALLLNSGSLPVVLVPLVFVVDGVNQPLTEH